MSFSLPVTVTGRHTNMYKKHTVIQNQVMINYQDRHAFLNSIPIVFMSYSTEHATRFLVVKLRYKVSF